MPTGLEFFITRTMARWPNSLLPMISILPTLTLTPSSILKMISTDEGGIWRICGRDGGELAAVFGLELLEHLDRAGHAALLELLLDGEPDVALLEAVENIGDADGTIAFVLDGADHAPLGQVVADDPARFALFAL